MSEMSKADAELVYKYLPDHVRGDVEAAAWDAVLSDWQDQRPSDLDALETAHDSAESRFQWEGVVLETQQRNLDGDEDLAPLAGVDPTDESEVYDLAHDFGWDFVAAVRDEIRQLQARTAYSPREFVALVLDAAEHVKEGIAHREMDISLGNYRGKKGTVAGKLRTAEETVRVTERLQG